MKGVKRAIVLAAGLNAVAAAQAAGTDAIDPVHTQVL